MRRVMGAILGFLAFSSCQKPALPGCGGPEGIETRPARQSEDLPGIIDAINRSQSNDVVDSICPELLSISMDVQKEYSQALGGVLFYPPFGLEGFDETLISMTPEEALSPLKKPEYILVIKLQDRPSEPRKTIKVDNQSFLLSNKVMPVGWFIRDRQTMELYGKSSSLAKEAGAL